MGFTRASVGGKITAAMYNELADAPRFYSWPTVAQKDTTTSMVKGDFGYQVDADIIYRYSGTIWKEWFVPWRAYTPATTGISGGTIDAHFSRIGDVVDFSIAHTLTGANITAQPFYDLPRAHASARTEWLDGTVLIRDAAPANEIMGIIRKADTGRVAPYAISASQAFAQFANVGPTSPFTFAADDSIVMNGSYRCAT